MDLTCRFVVKGNENFGESIDEYGEYLIVKVEAEFIAVPKSCIERVENDTIIIGDFDENEAREVGKKWIEEKSKPVSMEELRSYGFGEE